MFFLATVIITFLSIIFILLFGAGSAVKGTWIAKANIFLMERLPQLVELFFEKLGSILRRLLGESLFNYMMDSFGFIMNEKHPVVQIFYLCLITGGLLIFLFEIAPRMPNKFISDAHWYVLFIRIPIILIVFSTYGCFFAASLSDPGHLDSGSSSRAAEKWPLDHILYDRKQCRTCLIERPARSKHCPVCKVCVAKLDHHCVWINNCVGYNNHKWFILFLFTTTMYCFYGTYLAFSTLRYLYEFEQMVYLVMPDEHGNQIQAPFLTRCIYLTQLHPLIGSLAIFAALAGAIVYLFLQYQLYLIVSGVTTSESFKWDDLGYAIHNGSINTISPHVLQFNQKYKFGETLEDYLPKKHKKKGRIDFEEDQVPLTDMKMIKNIYHLGAAQNLYDVFFPKKL
jgi:palmitoyltransferase ZDHHC4